MLNSSGSNRPMRWAGLTRRSFLQVGSLGLGGLGLADMLRLKAQAQTAGRPTRDTAVIVFWLDGGLSHIDSYDPKPDAPEEFRGFWRPQQTNVPGIQICNLMPRQARIMDKLAIIRTQHHTENEHHEGTHLVLTGYRGPTVVRPAPQYPSAGSITARLRGANHPAMPAYVALPFALSVTLQPGYHGAAYLGGVYNPFCVGHAYANGAASIGSDPNQPNFRVQNMSLPQDVSASRLQGRRGLLNGLNALRREADRSGVTDNMDRFQREAFELISGPRAQRAFEIEREEARTRDMYGRNTWGQCALLARRLVEAGVTFVSVNTNGWDNHSNLRPHINHALPILDQAIAGLVTDLVNRRLYERVAVFVFSEFGRTPRINKDASRDHWCQAGSIVMGGGGIRGGTVIGSTTSKGEVPRTQPVSPGDMLATLYHILGIDPSTTFNDQTGRPVPILAEGERIPGLF